MVIFTSGTAGQTKAALHDIERFLHKFSTRGRCFRTLALMLLDHVAGLDTLFYTLLNGATLILPAQRDPRAIVQLIMRHRVEALPASPSFLRMLCAVAQDTSPDSLSSLKVITYGSELMDQTTLSWLNAKFPRTEIIQKYGTTEIGSPRTERRANDSLWLKIKRDSAQTKIVNGVLWVRSEGIALGYLNAPSTFDAGGWYCTGDLVDVDGDWIKLRGRETDSINVGGRKVSPFEVEEVILKLTFVRSAVVSAIPHPLMGQIVAARVVLTGDAPTPAQAVRQIKTHCQRLLASYKMPLKVDVVSENLIGERHKIGRHRAN